MLESIFTATEVLGVEIFVGGLFVAVVDVLIRSLLPIMVDTDDLCDVD